MNNGLQTAKNDANYSIKVNKTDTFIFFHLNITSFAQIISPFEMYLLTFLGSYATRYTVAQMTHINKWLPTIDSRQSHSGNHVHIPHDWTCICNFLYQLIKSHAFYNSTFYTDNILRLVDTYNVRYHLCQHVPLNPNPKRELQRNIQGCPPSTAHSSCRISNITNFNQYIFRCDKTSACGIM